MARKSPRVCLVPPWFTETEVQNRVCGDGSHAHVTRADADELVSLKEAEWFHGDRIVRRLNFCKSLRDKSVKLGEYLNMRVRQKVDWALAMEAQMRGELETAVKSLKV